VIVCGSGGVLEHEGEERKVRGMATWPEGLQGRRSSEGGKMVAAAIILGRRRRSGWPGWTGGRGGEVGRCARSCQGGSNTG
jgi:hypothetical protein